MLRSCAARLVLVRALDAVLDSAHLQNIIDIFSAVSGALGSGCFCIARGFVSVGDSELTGVVPDDVPSPNLIQQSGAEST